jgi:voltage-gated potassium channel
MSESSRPLPTRRRALRDGLLVLLRVTVSLLLLMLAYWLIPTRSEGQGSDTPWLILSLAAFGAVAAVQVVEVLKSSHPILRAVQAMAVLIPVYLLIFARLYLSISLTDPSTFSRALDHTTALYFTVTVFATVGFGDIVAESSGAMRWVTAQMLLNLVVLGSLIRVLTSAARRGVARRGGVLPDLGDRPGYGDRTGQGD